MSDAAADSASTPKKGKGSGKPKKPRVVSSHPKVSEMVNAAITSLKERGGSSLQAIKKYIGAHYKVDLERLTPFIKKYLRTAVASGVLVQTKGKGATGSFRVNASGKAEKGGPKKAKKAAPAKKPKPVAAKKPAKPQKVVKKPVAAKKPKAAKSTKKPQSKPKSPKPKKAKPGAKKGAAKKGGRK